MENFQTIYSETKRKKLIKEERKKLVEIFQNEDETTYKSIEKLIDDVAFMAVTLSELRLIVSRDGPVETYQNGENQKGLKKSAAVEAYDKMVNTYTKVIKQMADMKPKIVKLQEGGTVKVIDDDSAAALLEYVNRYKK